MSPHPSTDPTGPIGQMLRDELLQELIEVATRTAHAQIDELTTRMADALQDASAGSHDEQEVARCRSSAELLRKNRYPFYYLVAAQLSSLLEQEILSAAPTSAPDDNAPPATILTVDSKASLSKASAELELVHAERLALLNRRLTCVLGRENLPATENPFRPAVFLSALQQAWCEFQPDADSHYLVMLMMGQGLCLNMEPILHALNVALIKRGITPGPTPARCEAHHPVQAALSDRPLQGTFPLLFEDGVIPAEQAGLAGQGKQRNGSPAARRPPAACTEQKSKQEVQLQAEGSARLAVALRIGSGEVLAFVEAFLLDKWVSVLTLAYRVRSTKPEVVENALHTMDDLLWSVRPKTTTTERKELVARLPRILALLNQWLDLIKWHGPQREAFFNMLAEHHVSIMRVPISMPGQRPAASRAAVTAIG